MLIYIIQLDDSNKDFTSINYVYKDRGKTHVNVAIKHYNFRILQLIYEIIWRHKEHNIACPSFMFTCSQMLTWLVMRGNYNVLIYIHQLHMMGTLCKIRSTLVKPCVFKNNYFFSNKYMNSIMSKYLISYMQLNNNTRYLSRLSIVSNIPFPPQLFKQLWLPVYSFAWWSRLV